ncbi:MAG: division/cell wall cluster transcriptional repressor MraZ [Polyangiaceae bacterium]|nr:division/cell wall cluster transcriptional repressor MraZ [Polyangiaceae bacterium]MCW5790673.1 division/cell wall cluster transcriptional repressor MraZ [Polyangiaceae bacterium]
MFRGQFVQKIDLKGRVSMPARFRETLASTGDARFILTPAPFDPCLHVFGLRAWEEIERKISELPSHDRHVVRFRRQYVSAAVECETDRVGRVLIPPHLRERARLERDLLWAGMGKNVELWSKDEWERALDISPDDEQAYQRAVEQFPL